MAGVGSAESFEDWYRREHGRLLGAITVASGDAELAQDLVSEAFARALERWDRVSMMDSPTGWVREVAINLLRRHHRRSTLERRLLGRHPARTPETPSLAIDPDVWKAVMALPQRQRAVLGLRLVLDLSQADTARLLGIRPGTVSATLLEARRTVTRALSGDESPATSKSEVDHG